jgi:alkylation response protein AidB-like acyl-CoA dehydrogenase
MDFQLTDEQEELRDSVRAVLRQACPPTLVRQAFEAKEGEFDARNGPLWQKMVELYWPALCVPESAGGLGLGFVEVSLVAEEMGRFVVPSPFMATVTQFVPMLRETGRPEVAEGFLRAVADGSITGTVAVAEAAGRWEPGSVATEAVRTDGGWALRGVKSWVCDGASADEIVVLARGRDGLGAFVVPGASVTADNMAVLDPTQPLAEVTLDGVEVGPERALVEPGDPAAEAAIGRALEQSVACQAASINGTCRAIFETTLQYAKDREQYGKPIGSFQALKHRLVEMYTALERAAALASFAALTIAEDDERRALTASMAKAAAGECQRLMVQDGLQLHGGIGFTWENDLHMFLKRAKSGDFLFGTALVHRAAVARMLGVRA